jgi:adenosine deaminase
VRRVTYALPEHVRRLPKVELHCHLEGSARPSTIAELAAAQGITVPAFTFGSLTEFLAVYDVVCRSLVTAAAWQRITYEALQDAVRAGVRYREMFFSPGFVLKLGVPIRTVWDGIRAGIADAHADLDVRCRMILDVDKPSGAAHAEEMVAFAATQDRDLLIGVGGDSTEAGIDHRQFVPAFEAAAAEGLRRTMHAGEDGPAENVRIVLDDLGCERVDHGFHLIDDPALTRRVAQEQIPVTCCPTSNVVIANVIPDVAAHPFARLRAEGVLATLNSDDPGMMRFDLADEYVAVASAYGWDLETMEQLSLDGITASWAPDAEKVRMRSRFLAEFAGLRRQYGLAPRDVAA